MTNPKPIDYGPLAALIGTWRGDRGMDVAPDPDGGEWDGNVGARLLYKLVGWMLRSWQG